MKSIKTKIIAIMLIVIVFIGVIPGMTSSVLNYKSAILQNSTNPWAMYHTI